MKPLNLLTFFFLAACGASSNPSAADSTTYQFTAPGTDVSSVDYREATLRWVLLSELGDYLEELTPRIDTEGYAPVAGEVKSGINTFLGYEPATQASLPFMLGSVETLQKNRGELFGESLTIWQTAPKTFWLGTAETDFNNWLQSVVESLDAQATARANGSALKDASGKVLPSVTMTSEGTEYAELLPKALFGLTAFHQAAAVLLEESQTAAGLNANHSEVVAGKNYTALEHQWDLAFGYYGAARNFPQFSLEELAKKGGRAEYKNGYHDINQDGRVDLHSEYNFYNAGSAAKRDLTTGTNYGVTAFNAFRKGRELLAKNRGTLSADQKEQLRQARNEAIAAWEKTLVANTLHYLNDVLKDLDTKAEFGNVATHWSEMKGFSLALQLNPRSPLTKGQFLDLQTLLGSKPPAATDTAQRAALERARTLLSSAYSLESSHATLW